MGTVSLMEHQLELPDFGPRRRSNVISFADRLKERNANSDASLFSAEGSDEELPASLLEQVLNIHEYERKRLGQELHDSAGQLLVSLQLSVSRLRHVAERSGEGGLIDEIGETIRQIDHGIRALAFMEYPVELGDRDIFSALRTLALGFARRSGIRTSFKAIGEECPVGRNVSMSMLRVAQEALVNVHRHASAEVAKITLECRPGSLRMTISDDGIGMPVTTRALQPEGIGLQGMRHRVETLGGQFRLSNLTRGTKLTATIPLPA